jgi:hypothetical protein
VERHGAIQVEHVPPPGLPPRVARGEGIYFLTNLKMGPSWVTR